jgi:hypothetical protein
VATLISLFVAVYFLIPGVYHPSLYLSSGHLAFVDATKHPRVAMSAHRIYAAAFFVLAVAVAFVAFLSRTKKAAAVAAK